MSKCLSVGGMEPPFLDTCPDLHVHPGLAPAEEDL